MINMLLDNILSTSPGLVSIIYGIIGIFIPKNFVKTSSILCCILILYISINLEHTFLINISLFGYKLILYDQTIEYSYIFTLAFSAVLLIGVLYIIDSEDIKKSHLSMIYIYSGSSMSLISSGDFLSYFIFLELMTFSAAILILYNRNILSFNAGINYIKTHFLSSIFMFSGICYILSEDEFTNFIGFDKLQENYNYAYYLILAAILINCGTPPFTSWLTNGYSKSGSIGTIILPSFSTKTAIFSLIKFFPSEQLLIYSGFVMIFYGIIYALIEHNIYRILCYSLINQIGFMMVSIGIGSKTAIDGAAFLAFCHIFYKILFFMIANNIFTDNGIKRYSEHNISNYRTKFMFFCTIIASLSSSAFPFTSGFVSKSIIISEAKNNNIYIYILLLMGSAGIFLYSGVRFPYMVFFNNVKNYSEYNNKKGKLNLLKVISMISAISICLSIGIFPDLMYQNLLNKMYLFNISCDFSHIIHHLEILFGSSIAIYIFMPYLKNNDKLNNGFRSIDKYFSMIKNIIIDFAICLDQILIKILNNRILIKTMPRYMNIINNKNTIISSTEIVIIVIIIFTIVFVSYK